MNNVMGNRSTLVIAHRLTTVESCARVVVIQDGVVVESRVYNALKDFKGGYFAKLTNGLS